jgi:hypothetical protein
MTMFEYNAIRNVTHDKTETVRRRCDEWLGAVVGRYGGGGGAGRRSHASGLDPTRYRQLREEIADLRENLFMRRSPSDRSEYCWQAAAAAGGCDRMVAAI